MGWLRVLFYGAKILNDNLPRSGESQPEVFQPKDSALQKIENTGFSLFMVVIAVAAASLIIIPAFIFLNRIVGLSDGACYLITGVPIALYLWFLSKW